VSRSPIIVPSFPLLPARVFSTKMGALGQHTVNTTERLAHLRELMKQKDVGAFVVPSEDQREFLSWPYRLRGDATAWGVQIPASTWRTAINDERSSLDSMGLLVRLFRSYRISAYLLVGCAIVTLDKAFLFTDGRYFLQAEKQLDQLAYISFRLLGMDSILEQELDADEAGASWCVFQRRHMKPSPVR